MAMLLVYKSPEDGEIIELSLADKPITLGRGKDADITIHDEKASRLHCGIKDENGVFILRDLRSKNGTFVNEEQVDHVELKSGDRIRIGAVVLRVRDENDTLDDLDELPKPSQDTVLREVANQMDHGKGYKTLLKELVDESDENKSS